MKRDLNTELHGLALYGRDSLWTHLIVQEIPFMLKEVYEKKRLDPRYWASIRQYNSNEARQIRKLVKYLNDNADWIRRTRSPESKHHEFMLGFDSGTRALLYSESESADPAYVEGFKTGKRARQTASILFARKVGYKLPRQRRLTKAELEGECAKMPAKRAKSPKKSVS